MTSPVITYPKKTYHYTSTNGHDEKVTLSHLVITEDGTVNSKALGIMSKHDVMVFLGTTPHVLVKAIKEPKKVKQIKQLRKSVMILLSGYLEQNIPLGLIAKIIF
ncbi:hypothetical protein Q2T40_05425 [Winogradskyella maritima]|nr:hypothetical protein [Winogradskyella maritima]